MRTEATAGPQPAPRRTASPQGADAAFSAVFGRAVRLKAEAGPRQAPADADLPLPRRRPSHETGAGTPEAAVPPPPDPSVGAPSAPDPKDGARGVTAPPSRMAGPIDPQLSAAADVAAPLLLTATQASPVGPPASSFVLTFPPNAWPLLRAEGVRGPDGLVLRLTVADARDASRVQTAADALRGKLRAKGLFVARVEIRQDPF